MSSALFRARGLRFYFFSREELRVHIHVRGEEGEAKFWLDPEIWLAGNWGLSDSKLKSSLRLIREREGEIRAA